MLLLLPWLSRPKDNKHNIYVFIQPVQQANLQTLLNQKMLGATPAEGTNARIALQDEMTVGTLACP